MTRAPAHPPPSKGTYERIYATVRRIPRGRVATYGQIARLSELPGHARQVGYALAALQRDDVPWQRVINARGEISPRAYGGFDELQRTLLEDEGVEFSARGRIDLQRFRWRAGSAAAKAASRLRRKSGPSQGAETDRDQGA